MPSLVLEPMTLHDFDEMAKLDVANGDDLSSPPLMRCWPLSNPENNAFRTSWSANQQRQIFLLDPTVHFLKVVDLTDSSKPLIAVARWHRYERGFQVSEFLPLELYGENPDKTKLELAKHGLKVDAHEALITKGLSGRPDWTVQGPQWGEFPTVNEQLLS